MIVIHSILIFCAITFSVLGVTKDLHPRCFQFTWLGRETRTMVNCTAWPSAPCVEPFVLTSDDTPPNVTYIWENLNQTVFSCPMSPGYACLKYSYTYNNAVLNMTYFCGKMIEDKTLPITDGCYTQKASGHVIEACACKSGGGMMPCNSSNIIHNPKNMLIIVTLISIFVCNNLIEKVFFLSRTKMVTAGLI